MDRYLFRGKRVDSGEWVIGDLQHNELGDTWITQLASSNDAYSFFYNVKRETVGQCTGQRDQASSKNLMFENDALRVWTYKSEDEPKADVYTDHVIKWMGDSDYPAFDLEPSIKHCECNSISHVLGSSHIVHYEIVGNAHDQKGGE